VAMKPSVWTRSCFVVLAVWLVGCASSGPTTRNATQIYQESYPVLFDAAEEALRGMRGRIQGTDKSRGQILATFDQGPQYGDLELGVQISRPGSVAQGFEVQVSTLLPPKADGSDTWLREAAELKQEFYRRLEQELLVYAP